MKIDQNVATLGIAGSYHHQACKLFGFSESISFHSDFESVFAEVAEDNSTNSGVVALENSHIGKIVSVDELLNKYTNLSISQTITVEINHCLIGVEGSSADRVQKIYSHPLAFEQCSHFLENIGAELIPVSDTATAVKNVIEGNDKQSAAIGSLQAAEYYGGTILTRDIQNRMDNQTTFGILIKS